MEINELDTFIETDQGKEWLTRHIQPLADSKAQILSELKMARGREAESAQRAALAEKLLADQAAQRAADEAEARKDQLRNLAAKIAADAGISIDPEKFIGADEATTRTLVETEAERFSAFAEKKLRDKFGNVGRPVSGATPPVYARSNIGNLSTAEILSHLPELTKRT